MADTRPSREGVSVGLHPALRMPVSARGGEHREEAGMWARAGAPSGAPEARVGLPGVWLQPSPWLGQESTAWPPYGAAMGAHARPPAIVHVQVHTLTLAHDASGSGIHRLHPRLYTHTHSTPSTRVLVKVGGYTPTALWACIPALTLIHTSLCPGDCTKAGCPGSTDPCRDHPLTLHRINEAVALGVLRARPPGQPQKGWARLHHAKIHRGASTAFWRHVEGGMSPQPQRCGHPMPALAPVPTDMDTHGFLLGQTLTRQCCWCTGQ